MLCNRRGERLEDWASQAEASAVSELRSFAKGLRRDWGAVSAGLTVSYSSSPVEGTVNKMIKRQMYGRAKTRPAPQTRPARRLNPSRQLGQSRQKLTADNSHDFTWRSFPFSDEDPPGSSVRKVRDTSAFSRRAL
jgi:hypothetical protein